MSKLSFGWWSLVESSELVDGVSLQTLDSTIRVNFKDNHSWILAVRELSSINHSVTLELIACEPASAVSSVLHTISLKRISSSNTHPESTFMEWSSDYSSDANAEIMIDSSFKRIEAIQDLSDFLG